MSCLITAVCWSLFALCCVLFVACRLLLVVLVCVEC